MTLRDKYLLWKLKRCRRKEFKEFLRGNYAKSTYYGELVNQCVTELEVELSVPR